MIIMSWNHWHDSFAWINSFFSFQSTEIPLYKKLYENTNLVSYASADDFYIENEVAKGTSIYMSERTGLMLRRLISRHACNLALGKESFYAQNIGFPVRKSFPYKKEFNRK